MLPPVEQRTTSPAEVGGDIAVRVGLHADLRRFFERAQVGPKMVQIRAGATVRELLALLLIPDTEMVTVGINGELAQRGTVLRDRDEITMFSPMEGG